MHKFDQISSIYQAALAESIKGKPRTLFHKVHKVEKAGYGAILSRLMTGLNISLALDARYTFSIESAYDINSLFNVEGWQPAPDLKSPELIVWDFYHHTWNANPAIRANHQYPECPFKINYPMGRCSIPLDSYI